MEVWTTGSASPRGIMREAPRLEAGGWDGLLVVDSQNLSGDPYVSLAMAATVTERLGLGTGVSNSVTRVAAVTAASIESVNRVSRGRAVLGIGRGDSALAHLGRAPARVASFERYVAQVQAYLSGKSVPFEDIDIDEAIAPPMAELGFAGAPESSRIGWISGERKPPVEVAASGPKVIAVGARHADRLMFTLGADPERIAWGMAQARAAREAAGLDPDGLSFGAFVNCAPHPDINVARDLARGGVTTFARFSVMHGAAAAGPVADDDATVMQDVRKAYDMRAHTYSDSKQASVLTPEFIDQFAIVGDPDHCVQRLRVLAALGLDKIVLGGGRRGANEADAATTQDLLETEVLPNISR
ncbi:MAG: LLM class flavin-dependent oxidoreductase [Rhodospirillaceae bacterium]|jgi:5,10-methylenetetrahydromethanopterin reductase|nr:LLM class flavin-dependent oxidoreductase [Rhodospirillaceae bacterium]MBT5667067.1 LLM class flavin-dependent oxidoreductase [Rhodospirillaceae bacterium]